jgi:ABC-type multidrug transport system fused ATPase/permease subunit
VSPSCRAISPPYASLQFPLCIRRGRVWAAPGFGGRGGGRTAAVGPDAAAVETSGLSKAYGATQALADLDLRVEAGQVFGYLRPNGAGKTTTIRMLFARQRPSAGSAQVRRLDPH